MDSAHPHRATNAKADTIDLVRTGATQSAIVLVGANDKNVERKGEQLLLSGCLDAEECRSHARLHALKPTPQQARRTGAHSLTVQELRGSHSRALQGRRQRLCGLVRVGVGPLKWRASEHTSFLIYFGYEHVRILCPNDFLSPPKKRKKKNRWVTFNFLQSCNLRIYFIQFYPSDGTFSVMSKIKVCTLLKIPFSNVAINLYNTRKNIYW